MPLEIRRRQVGPMQRGHQQAGSNRISAKNPRSTIFAGVSRKQNATFIKSLLFPRQTAKMNQKPF